MSITPASPIPAIEQKPSSGLQFRFSWKWTLAIVAVGLMVLMWQCGWAMMTGKKLADAAVLHFHQQLDAGQFEAIYDEADQAFKAGDSREEVIKFLEAVHRKLGHSGKANWVNINVNTNTNGTFTTTSYKTTFDSGPATETFTWVKSGGNLKLYNYHIESRALIVN
jgi:uncharacterized protein DUF4019